MQGATAAPSSGRSFVSTRSQRSVALPVRVQRYALDAFGSCSSTKIGLASACKTLAIDQGVAASLIMHEFPRELYHTALDHSRVRPLLVQRASGKSLLSGGLTKLSGTHGCSHSRNVSVRSLGAHASPSAPPGLPPHHHIERSASSHPSTAHAATPSLRPVRATTAAAVHKRGR